MNLIASVTGTCSTMLDEFSFVMSPGTKAEFLLLYRIESMTLSDFFDTIRERLRFSRVLEMIVEVTPMLRIGVCSLKLSL